MKSRFISLILMMIALCCFGAITQTGYVKTRGRLGSNGNVIPGRRLPSATIVLRSGSSVVSNQSGNFSLSLPGNTFYLKDVKKSGYVVADPDMLSKQYSYSANPLILVLDAPTALKEDKLAGERKLRRNLQLQLQRRENELDALKKKLKITQEKYHEELQKLYSEHENNVKFVSDMAESYSKIDFDQLDDFQRQIIYFIDQGELARADSLLLTKGSMEEREKEIEKIIKANEEEEKELTARLNKLNERKKAVETLITDYCTDCYNRFKLCKLRSDNDSAAYWLKQRVLRDPANIEYKIKIGEFLRDYLADYPSALNYFQNALAAASDKYGDDDEYLVEIYTHIGKVYCHQGDYHKALENHLQAKDIILKKYGYDNLKLFEIFNNIGYVHYKAGDYGMAEMNYHEGSLVRLENALALDSDSEMANYYNNVGSLYLKMGCPEYAFESLEEALKIRQEIFGDNHPEVAAIYNNLGEAYTLINVFDRALECYQNALKIQLDNLGKNHPDIATSYCNIGKINLYYLGNFEKALENFEKALEIRLKIFGEISPEVEYLCGELANTYRGMHDFEKEVHFRKKLHFIRIKLHLLHP